VCAAFRSVGWEENRSTRPNRQSRTNRRFSRGESNNFLWRTRAFALSDAADWCYNGGLDVDKFSCRCGLRHVLRFFFEVRVEVLTG
jgi:hypothetical protein